MINIGMKEAGRYKESACVYAYIVKYSTIKCISFRNRHLQYIFIRPSRPLTAHDTAVGTTEDALLSSL